MIGAYSINNVVFVTSSPSTSGEDTMHQAPKWLRASLNVSAFSPGCRPGGTPTSSMSGKFLQQGVIKFYWEPRIK